MILITIRFMLWILLTRLLLLSWALFRHSKGRCWRTTSIFHDLFPFRRVKILTWYGDLILWFFQLSSFSLLLKPSLHLKTSGYGAFPCSSTRVAVWSTSPKLLCSSWSAWFRFLDFFCNRFLLRFFLMTHISFLKYKRY